MNRFYKHKQSGFTLVELLVALMIAAIVLAAAATMADALACGKETCDRMSRSTSYLLQIQTRLSDLIMRANAAAISLEGNLTLGYDTNDDGLTDEAVIVSKDALSNIITITENGIATAYTYQLKNQAGEYQNAQSNVVFGYDGNKLVTVKFDLTENSVAQTHQVCAALRGK
ncbi:MAG: prepilin-type N-terminal cleavage/methylation domain-containing protein [Planctomycetes bacterium]|nr:prepilin-type N-terminal cleavage/methylation domain-containing protein [Planctomycetota bacterium]